MGSNSQLQRGQREQCKQYSRKISSCPAHPHWLPEREPCLPCVIPMQSRNVTVMVKYMFTSSDLDELWKVLGNLLCRQAQ